MSLNGVDERKKMGIERLASIYEASAIVGHDLRNLLQAIIGSIKLVEEKLKTLPDGEKREIQKRLNRSMNRFGT